MKRVLTYLMIISVMLLMACTQRTGSGNVLTDMRNVDNFVGIIVSGEMSINIIHSDKYEVKITADDNLIKHIKTVVKSGILYVECGHQVEESNITVNLAMPVLNSIETEGKVDINVKSGFAVENLEIRTFGSGNLDISGITASAAIKILSRGSGNISLTGSGVCHP